MGASEGVIIVTVLSSQSSNRVVQSQDLKLLGIKKKNDKKMLPSRKLRIKLTRGRCVILL